MDALAKDAGNKKGRRFEGIIHYFLSLSFSYFSPLIDKQSTSRCVLLLLLLQVSKLTLQSFALDGDGGGIQQLLRPEPRVQPYSVSANSTLHGVTFQ